MTEGLPIGAVLVAAGTGSRMGLEPSDASGGASKLTLPLGASTVVGSSLRALLDAGVFGEVAVVVGYAAEAVEAAVSEALRPGERVSVVRNARYAVGQAGSIRVGVRALSAPTLGVAVALGDVPLVRPSTVQDLAARLRSAGADAVVRPVYGGVPGHPVFFGAAHRGALASLDARDGGGRSLLRSRHVVAVDVNDAGVTLDIDTPEAYRAVRDRVEPRRGDEDR